MSNSVAHRPISDDLADRLGDLLRQVRRDRGMRIRHLADDALPVRALRAAEAGRLPLDSGTVTELARRYGLELDRLLEPRTTVDIGEDRVRIDDVEVPLPQASDDDPTSSVMLAYLDAVREVRSLGDDALVALRRGDVDCIAEHFELPPRAVVERLGALMGATPPQRSAMVGLYLANASVIGCISSS